MIVKFNKFERVAGLFVVAAAGAAIFVTAVVAVKKGWFSSKVEFTTVFDRAQGIYPGTHVEVSGLLAGSVDSIELQDDNRVIVRFTVQEKFFPRIRSDSYVVTKRPFIIGDKSIEIVVGKSEGENINAGANLPSKDSFDIMDMMDGQKIGPYFDTLAQLVDNLKVVAEAFLDPKRSNKLIAIFDKIDPFMEHATVAAKKFSNMSDQLTHEQNLGVTMQNMAALTKEMGDMIKEMPNMSKDMAAMVKNTASIVSELNKVMPAIGEMAPEMPKATRRMLEAIDEAVIVLKAMQKSFLLSGSAKDVREEEEKRQKKAREEEEERKRAPASQPMGKTSDK